LTVPSTVVCRWRITWPGLPNVTRAWHPTPEMRRRDTSVTRSHVDRHCAGGTTQCAHPRDHTPGRESICGNVRRKFFRFPSGSPINAPTGFLLGHAADECKMPMAARAEISCTSLSSNLPFSASMVDNRWRNSPRLSTGRAFAASMTACNWRWERLSGIPGFINLDSGTSQAKAAAQHL
jgi:hypothetical protein